MRKSDHFITIALGANVALPPKNPSEQLHDAVEHLSVVLGPIRAVSRFFRTPCFPVGAGPDYVNAAVALHTHLSAADVLDALHTIEAKFDRTRTSRWAARTLDLDLLTYDTDICPNLDEFTKWRLLDPTLQATRAPDQLILPHPRIQDRGFVLVPLVDIAPDWRHPALGLTATEMLNALSAEQTRDIVPI